MSEAQKDHDCEGTKTGNYLSTCTICAFRENLTAIKGISQGVMISPEVERQAREYEKDKLIEKLKSENAALSERLREADSVIRRVERVETVMGELYSYLCACKRLPKTPEAFKIEYFNDKINALNENSAQRYLSKTPKKEGS